MAFERVREYLNHITPTRLAYLAYPIFGTAFGVLGALNIQTGHPEIAVAAISNAAGMLYNATRPADMIKGMLAAMAGSATAGVAAAVHGNVNDAWSCFAAVAADSAMPIAKLGRSLEQVVTLLD